MAAKSKKNCSAMLTAPPRRFDQGITCLCSIFPFCVIRGQPKSAWTFIYRETSRKRPALPGRNKHHGPYFYVLVHMHFAGFFPSKLLHPSNAPNLAQFEELGFSLIFQLTLIFSLILFVNMLLHAITVILMCISVGWVLPFPSLPRSTDF